MDLSVVKKGQWMALDRRGSWSSVAEMAHACGVHRKTEGIAGVDALLVVDRTAGLNDGLHTSFRREFDTVWKGEERVGGHARAFQIEPKALRLFDRLLQGVDPACLAGSAGEKLSVFREHHGVRFRVFDELQRKQQVRFTLRP